MDAAGVDASPTDQDGGALSGDAGCEHSDPEWCDGVDNDCDGVVDNGEVCPDATVQNTEEFIDGVYLLGTTAEGSCGADALQRFWPTLAPTYYSGFDCYADTYVFRRTDNAIFYTATFYGLYRDVPGTKDVLVETPPCGEQVDSYYGAPTFGFDSTGALYYQCDDTVRRGSGVLIAQSIQKLVGVLGDGRTVVTRTSHTGTTLDFVALDAAGNELARLNPRPDMIGTLRPIEGATTVSGNNAYVAFARDFGQSHHEVVVYRLTAASRWERVRRAAVTGFGSWTLVISDGTIFTRSSDPTTTSDEYIQAILPNGDQQVVWREAEQTAVRAHIGDQLLVGPL